MNSAGDWFDPPLVRDDSRPVLTIVRNEADFDPEIADSYRDTVNDDYFFGAAAGRVKCVSITGKQLFSADVLPGGFYWVVTYTFQFNRDGWASPLLDQGFRRLVSGSRRAILVDGQPASAPVLLDGSGGVLTPGDPPVYQTYHLYLEADYSVFEFPARRGPLGRLMNRYESNRWFLSRGGRPGRRGHPGL